MNEVLELQALYRAVHLMMARLGADGEIDTRAPEVDAVMDAMHEYDGGQYIQWNAPTHPQPVTPAVDGESFICYLIDNCEREVIHEESLHEWLADFLKNPRYHKPVTPAGGEVVARRFVGVGELERTGYIPAGSAAEREDRNNEGDEVVAYRYVADDGVYNPFVRDWLDGSPDQLDLENIARHPGVRFEFAYSNPPVADHELQQKWFRRGWDMYVEIHGETHPPVADAALVAAARRALDALEEAGMAEQVELRDALRKADDALPRGHRVDDGKQLALVRDAERYRFLRDADEYPVTSGFKFDLETDDLMRNAALNQRGGGV